MEMTSGNAREQLMNEILNRKLNINNVNNNIGDKTASVPAVNNIHYEEEGPVRAYAKDPGIINMQLNAVKEGSRRRAVSQPGPVSGSLLTATAARAARKRPPRSVMYADDTQLPRSPALNNGEVSNSPTPQPITPAGDRGSPVPNNRNGDTRSLSSYRLYAPNDMKGLSPSRSFNYMDAQSIRSVETQAPPPTGKEENKKLTVENVTMSLSCIYAIFIVTLGLIINIYDPFIDLNVATIYSVLLAAMGVVYMLYLLFDIRRFKKITSKNMKIKEEHDASVEEIFRKYEEDNGSLDQSPPIINPPTLLPLTHDYCFGSGRHSGSFYLKVGAAGFALGHLVHSVLLLAVQVSYFLDENIKNDECVDYIVIAADLLSPLHTFFQLYFIFKFSNVIILRGQGMARFGFMHFIGSSLSFWVSAIVRETVLALSLYAQTKKEYETDNDTSVEIFDFPGKIIDLDNLYNEECTGSKAVASIYENFSPYLYPFTVEFNILIVAVYYIIWTNIGSCDYDDEEDVNISLGDTKSVCKIPTAAEENDFSSNIVIYADCHASNRGLFVGLIMMVLIIGNLILGFVFGSIGDEFLKLGNTLNELMNLILHVSMLLAAVIAFNQTRKMDINEHPISLLDDVLLFVCLPAFFMEIAFSLIASISLENSIKTVNMCVMFLQVIIQTSLIVDALRRCSNTRKLRRTKPGREVIMFLIIANVGMWIFYTFSYKSPDSLDVRYAYYGKVLWTILGHISLPLIMFFRFHSSVCFADIWDSAYKPGAEH
ncbi:unnamed protein product [Plutella xylostella]|uniref:(diamondback moth) hypothetical protein n=1 Tax=Plutella xylostella TaxID=51655 RepID=A0A8S4D6P7_PLUXY|nr:unnamed protein product [Plutella xylostella]